MTEAKILRLATAQYNISFLENWQTYEAKILHWVLQAAKNRASLLVFPEYFTMELASLANEGRHNSIAEQLGMLQTHYPEFIRLFVGVAQRHGVYIVAGSYPVEQDNGEYRNRAWLFRPDGSSDYQDKIVMTRFENEHWHISPGNKIKVLETHFGKIGINICYDSEFPLLARKQVESGASLILVPSCTDTIAGHYRVRIGCQARALENQCYVVQSSTVGNVPWSEVVDVNIGAAAVYAPPDHGFPDNGIVAMGTMNQPQWLYAELDMGCVEKIRSTGQVLNHKDWSTQFRCT